MEQAEGGMVVLLHSRFQSTPSCLLVVLCVLLVILMDNVGEEVAAPAATAVLVVVSCWFRGAIAWYSVCCLCADC